MCPRSSAPATGPRIGLIVLAGLLLACFLAVSGVTAATEKTEIDATETPLVLENNTIVIELDTDGDTEWTITWEYAVPENETEQFDVLAEEFTQGESDNLQTLSVAQNVSQELDEEHERSIQLSGIERSSSRNSTAGTGQLQLSFTWENFAEVDGDRLIIEDSLVTEEQGLWLDGLSSDQRLVVRIPPGYGVFDASVDIRDGALRWEGPTTFDETTLQATFVGDRSTVTPTPTPTPTPEPREDPVLQWGLFGFLIFVVVALLVLGVRYREKLLDPGPSGSDDGGPSGAAQREPDTPDDPGDAADAAAADSARPANDIDEELLSDEERVERLLETNGGRMKQADIVEETDWSNAKVSQLLSSMEEEDRIDKLRIGRENLISFPDVNVTELENDE